MEHPCWSVFLWAVGRVLPSKTFSSARKQAGCEMVGNTGNLIQLCVYLGSFTPSIFIEYVETLFKTLGMSRSDIVVSRILAPKDI